MQANGTSKRIQCRVNACDDSAIRNINPCLDFGVEVVLDRMVAVPTQLAASRKQGNTRTVHRILNIVALSSRMRPIHKCVMNVVKYAGTSCHSM